MDVTTAMPSPGEHGDSATDLPSKRLTEANILGSMNVVGSTTLCSSFCGGIYSSSLHTTAVKASSHLKATKGKAEPISTLLQPLKALLEERA